MKRKLLIIDDDENDILIMKSILSKIEPGVRVEAASSGEEGLACLQERTFSPALILLDVKMPGMSGIDVLRKIRNIERLNPIPVVMVTNSIHKNDLVESYKSGANSILLKTGDTDQFRRCISNLIERFMAE